MLYCSIDERLHGNVDGSARWYIVALTTVNEGTISSIVIKIKADKNALLLKKKYREQFPPHFETAFHGTVPQKYTIFPDKVPD